MPSDARNKYAQEWLDRVVRLGHGLSTWEDDFVESIDLALKAGRTLSEKQLDVLERIYANKTP